MYVLKCGPNSGTFDFADRFRKRLGPLRLVGSEVRFSCWEHEFVNLQSSIVNVTHSVGRSASTVWGLRGGSAGRAVPGCSAAALASARAAPRSSNLPKIILPAEIGRASCRERV